MLIYDKTLKTTNLRNSEIDDVARWFLLVSGPRVRVPGGAPQQQNPNFF